MPRPRTGVIESHAWKDGRTVTWRLRVRDRGRRYRIDLGTNHEGWNADRARAELERIMGQIERGTWLPPSPVTGPDPHETVHLTASRWWQRKEGELKPNTRADYRWRLDYLLAELARDATAEIDPRRVDDFRQKLVGRGLSPRSVNMVLDCLAQILDDAVEYGLLVTNPARGKRRRLRVPKPARTFLEPDMVVDLLDVAGEWEESLPEHQRYGRRALLALLSLAGPRISEAIAADRGDFDLAAGRWRIPEAKTDAGARDVELSLFLAEELRDHVAQRAPGPDDPMFPTWKGGRLNPSNIRNRLLYGTPKRGRQKPVKGAIERANERRTGRMRLPKVTPHSLRRTFASLALTAGRDPRWVMGQIGHTDARLTLSVYAQVMQRKTVDRALVARLMRFADEPEDALFGPTNGPTATAVPSRHASPSRTK